MEKRGEGDRGGQQVEEKQGRRKKKGNKRCKLEKVRELGFF